MAGPFEDLRDAAGEALDDVVEVILARDDRPGAVDLDQGELRAVMGVDDGLPARGVEAGEIAKSVGRPHRSRPRTRANR